MVRFGIVGAGGIAHKFAEDITCVKNAKLVAIASRNAEKSKEFADKFALSYHFSSYSEMAESNVIDAVYIATPHSFHMEHSILFLENKKHVLCEKPIAVNEKQFTLMKESAVKNKKLLMEGMWMRYLPAIKELSRIINEKVFGDIVEVDCTFGIDIINHVPFEGRHLNINLAGGSLLDVGVYPISLLDYTYNIELSDVKVESKFHNSKVDVYNEITVNEKNFNAILKSAFDRELPNKAIIKFNEGLVEVPNFFRAESLIINGELTMFPFVKGGFEYEIESFCKSVINDELENDIMPHSVSMRVLRLLDLIRSKMNLKYPFE